MTLVGYGVHVHVYVCLCVYNICYMCIYMLNVFVYVMCVGGLSIKTKEGMPGMKRDMGGSAGVYGDLMYRM